MTTPIYTYEQAIAELAGNVDQSGNTTFTLQQLEDLLRKTYTSTNDTTTLLYNNAINLKNGQTVNSWQIAESVGKQSDDIFKTFENSDAGKLLANDDFKDALAHVTSSQLELNEVKSGLISDISQNLAETASGSVRTMTGGTREDHFQTNGLRGC